MTKVTHHDCPGLQRRLGALMSLMCYNFRNYSGPPALRRVSSLLGKSGLTQQVPVYLRRLRKDDITEVVEIEREAFSPMWVSSPFRRDLNNRRACYLVACIEPDDFEPPSPGDAIETPRSWLSRLAGRLGFGGDESAADVKDDFAIAGYVSVWYQGDEAHIVEIAVRETLRGNGIGELLLIGSLREAVAYGSHVMTLEARVSNFIAQRLYEKYSFKSVGIRKGYYSDNREDAVIMTTSPIHTEEYGRMFRELQETWESRWGPISVRE